MKTASPKFETIDAYIATFPQPVQDSLETIRQIIHAAAPEAQEAIKYHMPTFTLKGNLLIHLAAFKHHIAFYGETAGAIKAVDGLAAYATEKGAIQFPLNQPIPFDLIQRMMAVRVQEVVAKQS